MARRGSRYASQEDDRWPDYIPVAERRRRAALEMDKLRRKGHPVSPVQIAGRAIATTFWGQAWCDNLERYRDYANRIERGRTYVRNGSVVDLQIAPREVLATVCGSALYKVTISIGDLPSRLWASICQDCAGRIDSLVEVLQGRFAKGLMQRLCRQGDGLFPTPAEIRFSCSCLDHAAMCKHVAAALYGVGARLDAEPALLFRLRAVDANDVVARVDPPLLSAKAGPASGKVLREDDLSEMFGLDIVEKDSPAEAVAETAAAAPRRTAKSKPNGKQPTTRKTKSARMRDAAWNDTVQRHADLDPSC
jgi:uncharacterized Zn finger protein